jgi:hypothetical protein
VPIDSPVVLLLKVAYGDEPGTATNSKLVFYQTETVKVAMKKGFVEMLLLSHRWVTT